jgi:hypothetical protein
MQRASIGESLWPTPVLPAPKKGMIFSPQTVMKPPGADAIIREVWSVEPDFS